MSAETANRWHRFLLREQEAAARELHELWSLPPEARADRGEAIRVEKVLGWDEARRQLRLFTPDQQSRFRAGDRLHIGTGVHPAAGPELVYLSFDPKDEILTLELPSFDPDPEGVRREYRRKPPLWLDRAALDTTGSLLRALARVFDPLAAAQYRAVAALFEPGESSSIDRAEFEAAERSIAKLAARGVTLNDSQHEAFVRGWAERPVSLVQGPPGTGKTWLLAWLIAALAWREERILFTAFTHAAIDNALLALERVGSETGYAVNVVRVGGSGHEIQARGRSRWVRSAKDLEVRPGMVVAATPLAAQRFSEEARFDRMVIDEAAQLSVPYALAVMPAARRWLLFGDDRQLGPVHAAVHDLPASHSSLFSQLSARFKPVMLRETYRLNRELCDFPSRAFYGGRLEAATGNASRRLELPTREDGLDQLFAAEPSALWLRVDHDGCHRFSTVEVDWAVQIVAGALQRGIAAEQIGVIAPFRLQCRELRHLLGLRLPSGAALPTIDTVERIQGQERDLVIVSLTCSDPEALAKEAEFFFSSERLNVAITRARRKLIVLASPRLLETVPATPRGLELVGLFHRLLGELTVLDPATLR